MGLPEAERGTDERQQADGAQRITVGAGETPRVNVSMLNGALRVLGDAETDAVIVRAVKPNGETVPVELVAEIQTRLNGEISIKVRPAGDIQRQIKRITKSFDGGRSDIFDNLGEMIDTLASMKTLGNNVDRVRLEITVPRRSDVALTTANGAVQVGRIEGSVAVQSASGNIDCARIGGNLSVKSASGSLRLGDITGTVSVNTASGDVTMRGVDGNLVIQTLSGDAQGEDLVGQVGFKSHSGTLLVRSSRLNGFYLNTTSGECLIEASLATGEYEVRTVSGDITVRPQPDLSAILSGRTVSGSFQCALPYQRADEDWRAAMDDDDDDDGGHGSSHGAFHGHGGLHSTEIDLPGLRIGKDGIDVGGFLRIDGDEVRLPGMRIGLNKDRRDRDRQRERRRGRNRWEYLIGDPATAASGETRLRIRTVSGDVTLRPGRSDASEAPRQSTTAQPAAAPSPARPATPPRARTAPANEGRGWPDSELWPTGATPPMPPTPPVAAAAPPAPPMPAPPELPLHPEAPTPPAPPEIPTVPRYADDTIISAEGNDTPSASAAATDGAATTAAVVEASLDAPADAPVEATDTDTPILLPAPATAAPAPEETPKGTAAAQPSSDQTRLEILEALRGGDITTDEALLLLRQLDI